MIWGSAGLLRPGRLWEWEGRLPDGTLGKYQCDVPEVLDTEEKVRARLQASFGNMTIVSCKPASVFKPSTKPMPYKAYTAGAIDALIAEIAGRNMRSRVLFGDLHPAPAAAGRSLNRGGKAAVETIFAPRGLNTRRGL